MKPVVKNVLLFLLALAIGAFCGAYFMHELKWDLVNYHYYNPWAFLHNRVGYDVSPASVNTYL